MRVEKLPAIAAATWIGFQASATEAIRDLEAAMKNCEKGDKVCHYEAFEQAATSNFEALAEEMGAWLYVSFVFAGIEASTQLDHGAASSLLTRAINLVDRQIDVGAETYYLASPLHFLRAEHCLEIGDEVCFRKSTAFLLEREIASRKETIAREKWKYDLSSGQHGHRLDPPILWSEVKNLRRDMARTGGPKYGWGDIAQALDRDGVRLRERLDAVLSEAERRM